MRFNIEDDIFESYPETEIGYLVAKVSVRDRDPFIDDLKELLSQMLHKKGINATNFAIHPRISIWRKMYQEDFQVSPKAFRSSLESLVKRVITGKKIWNICNIVDLYNCASVLTLLPMGGYDLNKVSGDISIRFANEGESFQALGQRDAIQVKSNHVVYADDARVICWLWNHKDSSATCIDESTNEVIFFIDSIESETNLQDALNHLAALLEKIQCVPVSSGVLNKETPHVEIKTGQRQQ